MYVYWNKCQTSYSSCSYTKWFSRIINKTFVINCRLLLMRAKLLTSIWGHVILYATSLMHTRSTTYHKYSSLQLTWLSTKYLSFENFWMCSVRSNCHHNVVRWVLKEGLEYMLDLISHQLLKILNPWRVMYLLHDLLIVI